jgi:phosphate transport system substrate-binding protein
MITFSGCKSVNRDPYTDTPTSGRIKIAADETFKNIIEAELGVFQSIYNYAEITPAYVPENELFRQLESDSVHLIIAARYLLDSEIQNLNKRKIFPRQTKIALDGIALIVNKENTVTALTMNQLKQIFTGEIIKWDEISSTSKPQDINIVFDNQGSSLLRMIVDSLCNGKSLTKKAHAMEFNKDVINYVSRNPGSIGLIGVSWISDKDDTLQLSFLKQIKVLALSRDSIANASNSYQPFQAYLAQGLYPLTREIIIINAEPRSGLASGLASFIAGDKGQRILLKTGVLPVISPTRLVNVRGAL